MSATRRGPLPVSLLKYSATFVACCIVLLGSLPAQAQTGVVAGRNVNMVSGTTLPNGDPYLQRQNEPSIAASTRNPLHLLAGANDYRTVDMPGLPNDTETGDAWLGVFKSFDGGQRWQSTLIPGFPQEQPKPSAPLGGYQAGADPVVRAGTSGMLYYSGLVFDRGTEAAPGKSAIFVSRFIDNNNLESGDPIAYVGTSLVEKRKVGSNQFLDKPWLAVDVPRGSWTCNIPATATARAQTIPAGMLYAAYTVITYDSTPDGLSSQIFLATSSNCGTTWNPSVRVSRLEDKINQGASIAINPLNGEVVVAWRRLAPYGSSDSDAIVVAKSTNQGRKFTNPGVARRFPRGRKNGLIEKYFEHRKLNPTYQEQLISEFDQGTSEDDLSFRTNAYPSMTFDDQNRLYLVWAERGSAPPPQHSDTDGDARIMMTTSVNGGPFPEQPWAVDPGSLFGHQIMPTLTLANGRLLLAYYDLREDVTQVFNKYVADDGAFGTTMVAPFRRHTIDLRATTAAPADHPVFASSTRVSEYAWGTRPGETGAPHQLQFNPPNLPLFRLGTVPFFGDYIDVAPAPAFIYDQAAGKWRHNTAAGAAPVFHGVWTDNRDVRPPLAGNSWGNYQPIVPGVTSCDAGMRNQNIYTARLTTGLIAGSPGNAKPLNSSWPRAFVVFAQNTTDGTKYFRFTILNQPPGGWASFAEDGSPATAVDVVVPRRSVVARTVYATSSDPKARIDVRIVEIAAIGGSVKTGGLEGAVVLNPDISNPDISNPDISNPDISNPDISNSEVHNPDISNPDISNPDISNPDISNPDISNPDISNPDISNPDISNPDISNPDISNPDISNPDISNPDISNPDISNPDISNGSISDVTWTVTNNGNTTTAFDVNLFLNSGEPVPASIELQLILYRVYKTPLANGCDLKEQTHNVLVANVLNPTLLSPSGQPTTGPETPTLWIEPGGIAKVTLRIVDKNRADAVRLDPTTITPEVTAQPTNTDDLVNNTGNPPPSAVPPLPGASGVPVLAFYEPPAGAPVGTALPPFSVSVTQLVGETPTRIGGVAVSIALATNPTGAELTGTKTVVSDDDGLAHFTGLTLTKAGTGFQFVASAGAAGAVPVLSNLFSSQSVPLQSDLIVVDGTTSLMKVAADGSGTTVFASMPSNYLASAIARDPNGDFIAVDYGTKQVMRVNGLTGGVTTLFTLPTESTTAGPVAVAVDSDGSIYVGDNWRDKVYRYTFSGELWSYSALDLLGPSPSVLQALDLEVLGPGVVAAAYELARGRVVDSSEIDRMDFTTETPTATAIFWPGDPRNVLPRPNRISGLAIEPSGGFVVGDFGATSGSVWRVAQDGSTAQLVATGLGTNVTDAEIDRSGNYIVSVNGVGDAAGSRIWQIEAATGAASLVATPGISYASAVEVVPYAGAGGALQFDGVDDLSTIPDSASLNLTSLTLEAWVKVLDPFDHEPPNPTPQTPYQNLPVLAKGASFGNYQLGVLHTALGSGDVHYAHRNGSGNFSCCSVAGAGPIWPNAWTHVAVSFDAPTGVAIVYVNGSQVATAPTSSGNPLQSSESLLLGAMAGSADFFNGALDEVRIWDYARSGADILANYNKVVPSGTAGLVGYWRFNEAGGASITDSSGRGNTGTLGIPGAPAANDLPTRVTSTAPIIR